MDNLSIEEGWKIYQEMLANAPREEIPPPAGPAKFDQVVVDEFSLYYDRWPLEVQSIDSQMEELCRIDLKVNRPPRDSKEEQELLDSAFAVYRRAGFPYPTTSDNDLRRVLALLRRSDSCIVGRDIKQSLTGYTAASSFHPSMYNVRCRGKLTPLEAFSDDDKLRRALLRRIRFGDNLRPGGLRRELVTSPGVQGASNFRPTAALSLIKHFSATNVLDFCMGWGGRMLGAVAAGVTYTGIDPSTEAINGNKQLLRQLRRVQHSMLSDTTIVWGRAEEILGQGIFAPDLILTSPPYFDTEHYSKEITQSYLRYPEIELWYEQFLGVCINGCYSDLRPGGHLVLNVSNAMAARTAEIAGLTGFRPVITLNLILGSRPSRKTGSYKHEPVLVFRKD